MIHQKQYHDNIDDFVNVCRPRGSSGQRHSPGGHPVPEKGLPQAAERATGQHGFR